MDPRTLRTVNWTAGLRLGAEHLRSIERHSEALSRAALRAGGFTPGLFCGSRGERLEVSVDEQQQHNRQVMVRLSSCVGVAPDGQLIVVGEANRVEKTFDLTGVRASQRVLIAVSTAVDETLPCGEEREPEARRNPDEHAFAIRACQLRMATAESEIRSGELVVARLHYPNDHDGKWVRDPELIPLVKEFEAAGGASAWKGAYDQRVAEQIRLSGEALSRCAPDLAWLAGVAAASLRSYQAICKRSGAGPVELADALEERLAAMLPPPWQAEVDRRPIPLRPAPAVHSTALLRYLEEGLEWVAEYMETIVRGRPPAPTPEAPPRYDYRLDADLPAKPEVEASLNGQLRRLPVRDRLGLRTVSRGVFEAAFRPKVVNTWLLLHLVPVGEGLRVGSPLKIEIVLLEEAEGGRQTTFTPDLKVEKPRQRNFLLGFNIDQVSAVRKLQVVLSREVEAAYRLESVLVLEKVLAMSVRRA